MSTDFEKLSVYMRLRKQPPAPGYLESLANAKLDFITDPISRIDETGIWTKDGSHHPVDDIIPATGFDHGFTSKFPVIGLGGVDLREKWSEDGDIGYPKTYLGIMAPDTPNYFTILQAQGNARGGTVPLQAELSATYIARVIRKIQSQSYVGIHPKANAATEFNDIVAGFFDNKVVNDKCNSWFKQGPGHSRILIAWPGSYHHRAQILREPRWEDFEYVTSKSARRNRFEYFGTGWTSWEADYYKEEDKLKEQHGDWDVIGYLKEVEKYDTRTVHEAWYE